MQFQQILFCPCAFRFKAKSQAKRHRRYADDLTRLCLHSCYTCSNFSLIDLPPSVNVDPSSMPFKLIPNFQLNHILANLQLNSLNPTKYVNVFGFYALLRVKTFSSFVFSYLRLWLHDSDWVELAGYWRRVLPWCQPCQQQNWVMSCPSHLFGHHRS